MTLAWGSSLAAQQQRPAVYTDHGACPFECCGYTTWTAQETVLLREGPDSTSAVVDTIGAGERVEALTGEVRTVPAPFLVKREYRGDEGGVLLPGDTVWTLTYLGEGRFRVWKDGEVAIQDLGFSPYGGGLGARCEGCDYGTLLTDYRQEWWVRIRRPNGSVGWTDATAAFAGKDGCGVGAAPLR